MLSCVWRLQTQDICRRLFTLQRVFCHRYIWFGDC